MLGPKDAGAGKQGGDIVIEKRKVMRYGDDGPPQKLASPELKQEAFAFAPPEGVGDDKAGQHQAFNIMTRRESRELKDGGPALKDDTLTFSIGAFRKQEFDTIDADKDGKVSLAEYQSHQRALFTRGFEMLGANSDKSLSADEYAKIVAPPMIRLNDDPNAPPQVDIDGGPKISRKPRKPPSPASTPTRTANSPCRNISRRPEPPHLPSVSLTKSARRRRRPRNSAEPKSGSRLSFPTRSTHKPESRIGDRASLIPSLRGDIPRPWPSIRRDLQASLRAIASVRSGNCAYVPILRDVSARLLQDEGWAHRLDPVTFGARTIRRHGVRY